MEREIRRLEERYGDDRNVSAEELDAKCQEIIDRYGLGEREFTANETYDPGRIRRWPRRTTPRRTRSTGERPRGAPDIRGRPRGEDDGRDDDDDDAARGPRISRGIRNRRTGYTRSRSNGGRTPNGSAGTCGRRGWTARGCARRSPCRRRRWRRWRRNAVTESPWWGAGRVHLSPSRSDVEILAEIREIGGEQYLWEFARFTRDELEESRKPPPPKVRY